MARARTLELLLSCLLALGFLMAGVTLQRDAELPDLAGTAR